MNFYKGAGLPRNQSDSKQKRGSPADLEEAVCHVVERTTWLEMACGL